jgi:hypothetical protein
MDIQTHASLASTRFVQLRTTIRRLRNVVVMVDTVEAARNYTCPYECITVGAEVTRAALQAGAPVVAAYWPTVQSDAMNPSDLQFLIATPNFEIPGPKQLRLEMHDFGDLYTHLGEWDGSAADAVAKLAALLRYQRVAAATGAPALHLVTQLWRPKQGRRFKELCEALRRNAVNPFVSRIHVLLESDDAADAYAKWPANLKEKIVAVPMSKRLTFRTFRDVALAAANTSPTDYFALVNADIYFDKTIRDLWNTNMESGPTCLALLRYEASVDDVDADAKLFGPRDDSQDAWIFRRDHLAAATDWAALDSITLGRAGCDNAIAGELVRRRWCVANPCMSIKALHLHESGLRTYRRDDMISLGVYATVAPSALLESPLLGASAFKVGAKMTVSVCNKYDVKQLEGGEVSRGMDALYRTVMPAKIGLVKSGHMSTFNLGAEFEEKTLSVLAAPGGAICTEDGLVAVGDGIGWSEDQEASDLAWTQTEYSSLTPTITIGCGVFLPLRARHMADEMLQVGRALALAQAVGRQDLVLPCATAQSLQTLVAGHLRLRSLRGRAMVCSEGAYGILPSLVRSSADWTGPAVAALRSVVGARIAGDENVSWTTFDLDSDVVDQLDDSLDLDSKEIANFVNKGTPPKRVIAALKASDVVVGGNWSTGYMWAARPGTLYLDLAPESANAAMATICGLRYVPLTFTDGVVDAPKLLEYAMRALRNDGALRNDDDGSA